MAVNRYPASLPQDRPAEPVSTDALERAEESLDADVHTWPTSMLENLTEPRRNIAPYAVPASSRHAYDVLWRGMDCVEATEILKDVCRQELRYRTVRTYVAPCPKCGVEGANIREYDGGRYRFARHVAERMLNPLSGKAAVLPMQTCYDGPLPVADMYEGDL